MKEDSTFPDNPVKIGQTAKENDQIIGDAKQTDMWFHLDSFPSCHVVIACGPENPLTQEMIEHCAKLTRENTKYRNLPNLKIVYTPISNVQRTDKPGKVTFKSNRKRLFIKL